MVKLKMFREAACSGARLADPRGCARPRDDRVAVEEQGRVFHENRVRIVGQLWQANDFKTRAGEGLFVFRVLRGGQRSVDRRPIQMRQLALSDPRAHGPRESASHQRFGLGSLATILISVMPVLGMSRETWIAVQAGGGPTRYLFFTATIAGICVVRSVWNDVMSTTSSQLAPLRLRMAPILANARS